MPTDGDGPHRMGTRTAFRATSSPPGSVSAHTARTAPARRTS